MEVKIKADTGLVSVYFKKAVTLLHRSLVDLMGDHGPCQGGLNHLDCRQQWQSVTCI